MKIKKITHSKNNSMLSNRCDDNESHPMVGSTVCSNCPLYWFRFGNFVFCHENKNKKEQPKWVYIRDKKWGGRFVCSECRGGVILITKEWKHCPLCGVKLNLPGEEK